MKQNMRKRSPLAVLLALCLAVQLCVPAAMASNRLMRAGDAAIAQIEEEEGFRAEKYSSGGKWYIGYGTECGAEDYPEGITREEAELLLMSKVEAYEAKLNDFFGRYDVTPTQGQFDALICFSYNFGTGWMSGTSDLVKIARGEMVRWMADQKIESVSDIREFKELGYRFSPSHSTEDTYTFSL
jgi:GH24 family phage-related lysozyme (muramidase)